MKIRWILVGLIICLIMLPGMASAKSQYFRFDGIYYNDEQLMGKAAKPTLKIGEPFTVAVEMTTYQFCQVYVEILDLGTDLGFNHFVVIDGPSDMGESYDKLFQENETYTFEWTLKATDEWAGGTMPINFYYCIVLPHTTESTVNSEFTVAVPYITTEYYEGDTTPPTTTTPESPTSTEDPATPAFTLLAAAFAITLAAARRS